MAGPVCDMLGRLPAIESPSDEATCRIGAALAGAVYPGLLVLLSGDLGAGKTTLVRAIGTALGISGVKSPTFSIESVHKIPRQKNTQIADFIHTDLYRVQDIGEFAEQFEESLGDGALLFVEWGERWKDAPLSDRWNVDISSGENGVRLFELSAYGEQALAALSSAYVEILDSCR